MDEKCRLCRKDELVFSESIFSYRCGNEQISEIIMKICPIVQIEFDDGLPTRICQQCLTILISAYELQKTSLESDNFYRLHYGSQIFPNLEVEQENLELIKIEDVRSSSDDLNEEMSEYSEENSYDSKARRKSYQQKLLFKPRPIQGQKGKLDSKTIYACNFCNTKLMRRSNISRHMLSLHDPTMKPFACIYCPFRFDDEEKKKLHEQRNHLHDVPSIIFCNICGASGSYQSGIDQHIQDDHCCENDSTENFLVKRRSEKFHPLPLSNQLPSLKYEDIWYKCNFCHKALKHKKNILRHIRRKHDPENLPFGCKLCIERFENIEQLNEHKKKHEKDDKIPLNVIFCEICGISGDNMEGMQNHKTDDHSLTLVKINKRIEVENLPICEPNKKSFSKFHPRVVPGFEHLKYDEIPYICNFCNKQLKPRKNLIRHMKRKHDPDELPFACRFCVERFVTIIECGKHESFHDHEPRILFCDICGASGDNKIGMENHMTDDHLKRNLENSLQSKQISESNESLNKCSKCDETFSTKFQLRNHEWLIHLKLYRQLNSEEVKQEMKCCACDETFATEISLLQHANIHRKEFGNVKCSHCPTPIRSFDKFLKHLQYHMKPKTHECTKCRKIFPFDSKMIEHIKSHRRKFNDKVICPKCPGKFRNNKFLEIHDKIKHCNQTLFMCPICAKSLSSEWALDNHIRYVHSTEDQRKHKCKFCPKKFTHKSKLNIHEATHSTERPFMCQICPARFKHKDGLVVHIRRHDGTLPKNFKCDQCSIRFVDRHRLAQHLLTHSGIKPHQCNYCDRSYTSKGDLVKHLQKSHIGNAVYRCEKCPEAFPRLIQLREHLQVHYEETQ
ncbi:CLUMA_CG018264, isoform A [Clunio marinus]|uniref:CLUMA_CG018264, isoform A n=1 Tax=Clunio marinus TaxID=568069 RepID=A0A1J1J0K7_9DIPT|nr:CLUMA_CG018264, isoform A [Clunio marinus]